ncbi:MAG: hypothetical protein ACKO58_00635 [Cyanobium sp.]
MLPTSLQPPRQLLPPAPHLALLTPAPLTPLPTARPAALLPALSPAALTLRLGVDPLHAHLLPTLASGAAEVELAFLSASAAVQRIKAGLLDAVLLPVAGMVGPSEPPQPPALSAVAALNPSLGDPEVVAIAVASSSLPLLVAARHLVHPTGAVVSPVVAAGTVPPVAVPQVAVLLPPARHQPLLHADLLRQALLPLRSCSDLRASVWIELLQRQRLLLPAPLSLLAASPWRAADFAALPAADPLWEVLWLLVAQGRQQAGWVQELVVGVRERVGEEGSAVGGAGLPE